MSLKNILKNLVGSVEGALGAIFIDEDGEEIDQFCYGDSEKIKLLGAYSIIHLRNIERINRTFCSGRINSAILSFDQSVLLISPVEDGYSVLLMLKPEGNIGKGIMRLEYTVKRILEEL